MIGSLRSGGAQQARNRVTPHWLLAVVAGVGVGARALYPFSAAEGTHGRVGGRPSPTGLQPEGVIPSCIAATQQGHDALSDFAHFRPTRYGRRPKAAEC